MELQSSASEGTPTLWNLKQVADYLQCSIRHVQNLQKRGLPYILVGRLSRFDPEEVRNYLLRARRVG